jgi:uncharacterized phiE125 gp8 family phage protein
MNVSENYNCNRARFNAVLDIKFSDQGTGGTNGAVALNISSQVGTTIQSDSLIGATVYLVFIDGIQYASTDAFTTGKQYIFDPATGTITVSIAMTTDTSCTVFYTSSATSTVAATEPVTLAEVKAYCKIDTGTTDDDILTELITTAREQCEDFTGISIIVRTVTTVLNNTCGNIYLPYCPLISLTSVTDQDGDTLVVDQDYKLSGTMFPQLVFPKQDRLTLVYNAGYGIPPSRIKTAILQQVFYLYENRGESAVISRSGIVAELTLSPQAKATLQRFRRVG